MRCLSFLRDEVSSRYLKEIRQLPLLSKDEEFKLANDWAHAKDKKAIDKLVKGHLRLVVQIAKGYSGYGIPMHDLISEGSVGMMQAIDHFKPDMGYRLSTYSAFWIKARIQEYIFNTKYLVKFGSTKAQKKLFFCLNKIKRLLGITKINEDNVRQVSNKLQIKDDIIIDADNRFSASDFSIHTKVNSEESDSAIWEDFLPDTKPSAEDITLEKQELEYRKKLFKEAFATIPRRERDIIVWYRLREPPLTLEAIGKKLGLSKERVRQLEARAMMRIKEFIRKKIHKR